MTEKEVLEIYERTGGLLRGHFLLSSGLHSDVYLQSALVLQHPTHAEALCRELATPFKGDRVQVVLADRKSTRLNSSHIQKSRMPSSA